MGWFWMGWLISCIFEVNYFSLCGFSMIVWDEVVLLCLLKLLEFWFLYVWVDVG